MINLVYFNPEIRCHRNGIIERKFKKKGWKVFTGKPNGDGYIQIGINCKHILVHRVIAYCFNGLESLECNNLNYLIDHINRNKTDNRSENLRIVTHHQQQFNKNAKGVYLISNKYIAQIGINKKVIYLGTYDTEEKAENAYLEAKNKYHIISSNLT